MGSVESESAPLLRQGDFADIEKCTSDDDDVSQLPHELYGYVLVASSGAFFEVMALLVRYLEGYAGVPARNILLLRGLVQCVLSFISAHLFFNRSTVLSVPSDCWPLLVLRGALGGVGLGFGYHMLERLPLGPGTTVYFMNPIFTLLLSIVVLRERVTKREVFACILCFFGIVLVANPSFSLPQKMKRDHVIGVVFGLSHAFLTAFELVSVRSLAGRIHFISNVLSMGIGITVVGIICGGSILPLLAKPRDITIVVLASCFGFLGQCFLNNAFKFCRASTGSVLRNLDVPLGYGLGLFIGEVPRFVAIIGSTFVVIGTAIVGASAAQKQRS